MELINLRNTCLFTILIFGVCGLNRASAVAGYGATPAELSVLPPFCQTKLSSTASATDQKLYSQKIGPDWLHIHHYCYGLNFINRYKKSFSNKPDQLYYMQSALGEFDYVFKNSSPTFWMRPEMHVQKGKLLAAAKRNIEAINEFDMALLDNPNYIEAYTALSDIYNNTGQKLKSVTTVEQALQRAPNNKSLQKRYNQLTGKIFTPPPLTVEQAAQVSLIPTPVDQAQAASAVSAPASQPISATPPAAVPEKIGTPSNPYCRFCPPE